jgi:hypothetical protein
MDRLRRFEQEAKTLAALNHPNVLTIHDAGVHDSAPYLVSELLEGKTLREEMNGAQDRKTLAQDPNYACALRTLGWSLRWKGDTAGALAEMQKAQSLDPDPWSIGCFRHALALSGDRAEAGRILRDFEILARLRYVSPSASMVV